MAVTWLDELKVRIAAGDVRAIYDQASGLPEDQRTCEYYWARYFHFVHDDFNLAVWEILDMAGLSEWMRLELEFDLASRHPDYQRYGRHIRLDYGRQLREFFQPEGPSERWAGWRASHRY